MAIVIYKTTIVGHKYNLKMLFCGQNPGFLNLPYFELSEVGIMY
jgi:hypothetical protein